MDKMVYSQYILLSPSHKDYHFDFCIYFDILSSHSADDLNSLFLLKYMIFLVYDSRKKKLKYNELYKKTIHQKIVKNQTDNLCGTEHYPYSP